MSVKHLQPYADQLIFPDTDQLIISDTYAKIGKPAEISKSPGHTFGHTHSRPQLELVSSSDLSR